MYHTNVVMKLHIFLKVMVLFVMTPLINSQEELSGLQLTCLATAISGGELGLIDASGA